MTPRDIVAPNEEFRPSINIDYDFGSKAKVESLIPTDSVCLCLEEILGDVTRPSTDRAKLLVGPYGRGKSHVVLAALEAMWEKQPALYAGIIAAYFEKGMGFGDTFEEFVTSGPRLLPVRISGSSADLRHSFLSALRASLSEAGLEDLMPQTNYDGAISVLDRWAQDYPETLKRFEELTGESSAAVVSRLMHMDTHAYEEFVEVYPELTSGGTFDVLDGTEVIAVYRHVQEGLHAHGIAGIYVVYDEFGKYLEANLERSTFEETRLLQDFAEACARSEQDRQLHLLLISHKSLSNYIDANIPKQKADGWRGVSGRFREIEMTDDPRQYYQLLAKAISKDTSAWSAWLSTDGGSNRRSLEGIADRYVSRRLIEPDMEETVAFGCYPLHPLTSFLLAGTSEKVAQNERTLFTFACSSEPRTLESVLGEVGTYVSPDYVYDYFEPALRREFYTSPIHRTYELASRAISKLEPDGLEARIVKTLALMDIVAQYDKTPPTVDALTELFTDCGFPRESVGEAIDSLIGDASVVYLRRSDSHLRLKETSGVNIGDEVSDRAASLMAELGPAEILNRHLRETAFYPSRYNEEKGMVRYFDCGFIESGLLDSWSPGEPLVDGDGDGRIVAVHCTSSDDFVRLKGFAKGLVSIEPMTVVVYPRRFIDVGGELYRLEAARRLKDEASDDSVLAEEFELVAEDCAEIVDDYIAGFFQPELKRSLYFVEGTRRNLITRRRRLSEELSRLCDETFPDTPRITSEALNKNTLTGVAFGSRTKVLRALLSKSMEPNLGFTGNGQETSMARSAFKMTGILPNFEESTVEEGTPGEAMSKVLAEIRSFIEDSQGTPFSELYDRLTGMERHIGMRRGPIPLYLAFELRKVRDEVRITRGGEERPLSADVLDDISRDPSAYDLTHIDWTPEMGDYVRGLAKLFGCNEGSASKEEVVSAMRTWYANLPQMTRVTTTDHAHRRSEGNRTALFSAIKRLGMDSDSVLFEELPRAFGSPEDMGELLRAIECEKRQCDSYLKDSVRVLAHTVKGMLGPGAAADASLASVVRDWLEANPATETHAFAGMTQRIIEALASAAGSDAVVVERMAKAATSLRVADWNDARYDDFLSAIRCAIDEVEGYVERGGAERDGSTLGILVPGRDGELVSKTFDRVECGRRYKLLKNSILTCLDDMGGSMRPEEKRQVVFDVLEGLC